MFEQFLQGGQRKAEAEAEKRQYDFAREQGIVNPNAPENFTDLQNYQDLRSDLIRWQQDLEEDLIECIMSLTNYRFTENGWIKDDSIKPVVNDKFIRQVLVPQCKPFMSKNSINSNYDEKEILMILKWTANDIANAMSDNWDEYDIEFTNYDLVLRNIKNTLRASANRAKKGWTKNTDSKITKRIEAYNENQNQERKKILGII